MEANTIMPVSHSVLLYNTQNVDSEVLKAGFSIRKKEYQRIWKDIQTGSMQYPEIHYLIQGVRGAGKTTLLSRLAYEVAEDENLNKWLIPILLNEEEYGILSLFTFWLRIAEKLAEQDSGLYTELFEQVSNLDDSAEVAWDLIQNNLDENKQKIIVFVDNLGELFKDFDDIEHAQLREVLSLHPQIRLIGGSSQLLEAHFDGAAPFYQFFKLVNLKPINEIEMHELLRSLAKQTSEEAVNTIEEIIIEHPERIEAVRRLTDGVPRTIVLLFQIIMEGAKESSYAYLEETIDKTTPLYKHRMDDLSRQQKAIVHVIAMNWDAMSTKEIAEQTRLPSKTVSAQLVKLQQQWIVDKIETNTKNHLYIIKERFFNIWYLMRYGNQKDKQRVLWLTRFLESWCDERELINKLYEIRTLIIKDRKILNKDYLNALLASEKLPYTIRMRSYDQIKLYDNEIINIEKEVYLDSDVIEIMKDLVDKGQILKALDVASMQIDSRNITNVIFAASLLYFTLDSKKNFGLELFAYADELVDLNKPNLEDIYELVISYFYLNIREKKSKALDLALKFKIFESTGVMKFHLAIIQIWNDKYEDAVNTIKELYISAPESNIPVDEIKSFYYLLLAKGQLEVAYNFLGLYNLKNELKPIYYATVSLLKDERQQEYLRMGSELQGTVDEILQKVEEYRVKYA